VGAPRELRLAHRRNAVRVEVRDGNALVGREFSLDDAADKEAFLDVVRDQPVETIHTLEPSLEDVFLAVTGRRLGDGAGR
jgi:fluoroquinolone transport system ATP-binding protein